MRQEESVWTGPARAGLLSARHWTRALLIMGLAACAPQRTILREVTAHRGEREVVILCGRHLCTVVPQGPGAGYTPTLTDGVGLTEPPWAEVEAPERLGGPMDSPEAHGPLITFEIHPDPPETKLPPDIRALLQAESRKPHVKHHIFPQEFEEFFKIKGINIHAWVIVLLLEDHLRIHRGAQGGPWNADWRAWIEAFGPTATKEDIYRFAGEMLYRYCLMGTLTTYYSRSYCSTFTLSYPKLAPKDPVPPVDDQD